jgi:hypothetical protein
VSFQATDVVVKIRQIAEWEEWAKVIHHFVTQYLDQFREQMGEWPYGGKPLDWLLDLRNGVDYNLTQGFKLTSASGQELPFSNDDPYYLYAWYDSIIDLLVLEMCDSGADGDRVGVTLLALPFFRLKDEDYTDEPSLLLNGMLINVQDLDVVRHRAYKTLNDDVKRQIVGLFLE